MLYSSTSLLKSAGTFPKNTSLLIQQFRMVQQLVPIRIRFRFHLPVPQGLCKCIALQCMLHHKCTGVHRRRGNANKTESMNEKQQVSRFEVVDPFVLSSVVNAVSYASIEIGHGFISEHSIWILCQTSNTVEYSVDISSSISFYALHFHHRPFFPLKNKLIIKAN